MEPAEVIVRHELEIAAKERSLRTAQARGNRSLARSLTRQIDELRGECQRLQHQLGRDGAARLHHWRMELDADYFRRHWRPRRG